MIKVKRQVKQPILVALSVVAALGIVRLLTTEQSLSSVMYAFYLFTVLIHEIGHSVAALLTGGQVHGFVVNQGSGGYALISGGSSLFILPAGYVGCAIFGSFFFYLSNRYRWADLSACLISVFIMLFTLMYGKPEDNGSMTAHYVATVFGILLGISGLFGPLFVNMFLVNVITGITALQGVLGAWSLYTNSQQWHHNDAVMFSTGVMPIFSGNIHALIWAIVSVYCFARAFYFGFYKTVFHGGKIKWQYFDKNTKKFYSDETA